MRGRHPSGPEFVDQLKGDETAKERLRVVLETIAGQRRVGEACTELGISEQRFDELRAEALQAAVTALEPKPLGREPRTPPAEQVELALLRHRVAELEAKLTIAAVRTEVAALLPHTAAAAEKNAVTMTDPPATQAEAALVDDVRAAPPVTAPRRLGRLSQRLQRQQREHQVRQHAVAVAAEIDAVGYTQREIANLLRITDRTLRQWRHDVQPTTASLHLPGRPAARSSPAERNAVIDYLDLYGPGLGLPPLREAFPLMTRAELDDLLLRYRRVRRERHRQPLHVLEWTTPGVVWAMDFAEAPNIIDGIGQQILAVRDLASGRQLLWQPLAVANAAATAEALAMLCANCGPPLVLKNDNGKAFAAPLVDSVVHDFRVTQLYSPPYTPSYNGSIEAGIGALKARTAAHAARHGRPNTWTLDDLVSAQLEANAYARPRGVHGPTPDESWHARSSIAREQRLSFEHAVEDHRCTVRCELQLPTQGELPVATQREVDRAAIRQALIGLGYLKVTRRLIPPPIPRRKVEVVS